MEGGVINKLSFLKLGISEKVKAKEVNNRAVILIYNEVREMYPDNLTYYGYLLLRRVIGNDRGRGDLLRFLRMCSLILAYLCRFGLRRVL